MSEPLPNVPLDDDDDQRVEEVKVNSCPKVLRHNFIKLHTNGKSYRSKAVFNIPVSSVGAIILYALGRFMDPNLIVYTTMKDFK